MPDVFISYSKQDQLLAQALADDLDVLGIYVWWDRELYVGENFPDRILATLDLALAVIVIWSDTAATSSWVHDEATRALQQDKLITTCVPGFDLSKIPLGFVQRHCVEVVDRTEVLRSLHRLGVYQDERLVQGNEFDQRERDLRQWAATEPDAEKRRRLTSLADLQRALGRGRRNRIIKFLGEHPTLGGPVQVRGNPSGVFLHHRTVNAGIPKHLKPEDLTLNQAVTMLRERIQQRARAIGQMDIGQGEKRERE